MAQRLKILLESSPALAVHIKELRMRNTDDGDDDQPVYRASRGWLEDDASLPQILPRLTNLERIYLAGSMSEALLEMSAVPSAVKTALFETWKSPKLTHIGFQCVQFASFKELLSVVSECAAVQSITFFAVDVDDDFDFPAELQSETQNHAQIINPADSDASVSDSHPAGSSEPVQKPPSAGAVDKPQQAIESLALFMEPELSSRFCAWLLGPQSNLSLSSLQKFSLVAELKDNLKVVHRVIQASTTLKEMNITIIAGDETYTVPFDISSLRVIHLGIDLAADEPEQCQTTLNWWCDNLTSSSTLSLSHFNIYILTEYDGLVNFDYNQPAWERLDGILSADDCSIKLRVQIKCLEDEDNIGVPTKRTLEPELLKKLEDKFPRMRDKSRLEVGQMRESIFSHL
ncbi:hypothetical protein V5O48_018811, partial [Marasmius crinis-equi]